MVMIVFILTNPETYQGERGRGRVWGRGETGDVPKDCVRLVCSCNRPFVRGFKLGTTVDSKNLA